MKIDEIRALLSPTVLRESPCGISCIFVKMNDKWGIKLYQSEDVRDRNYYWQMNALELGAGPELRGRIDNVHPEYQYGYITEIVEVLGDIFPEEFFCEHDSPFEAEYEFNEMLLQEMDELFECLESIGFNTSDLHLNNIGYKDGRYVCIDFGQDNIY